MTRFWFTNVLLLGFATAFLYVFIHLAIVGTYTVQETVAWRFWVEIGIFVFAIVFALLNIRKELRR